MLNEPWTDLPPTATAELAGSSLLGSASGLDMSGKSNPLTQDEIRRASAPETRNAAGSGGFTSIFNLKSVINAATKTVNPATSTSNFFVPQPEAINVDSPPQPHAATRSVQGIVSRWTQFYCCFVLALTLFLMIYCLINFWCFGETRSSFDLSSVRFWLRVEIPALLMKLKAPHNPGTKSHPFSVCLTK